MKDSQDTGKIEDRAEGGTGEQAPEDVAVLYSWANLHGTKYRDFSDSRREYRAQLKQRAAGHLPEQAAPEPEAADAPVRRAPLISPVAPAEAARREEREIAEAHESAQRQASRNADAEIRSHESRQPMPSLEEVRPNRSRRASDRAPEAAPEEYRAQRRPQGYHPEDASGVREIYRGSDDVTGVGDASVHAERDRRSQPAAHLASETFYAERPSAVIYKEPPAPAGQRRPVRPDPPVTADPGFAARRDDLLAQQTAATPTRRQMFDAGRVPPDSELPEQPSAPPRGRRAQDDFEYKEATPLKEPIRRAAFEPDSSYASPPRSPYAADPAGPAWLYAPPQQQLPPRPKPSPPPPAQPSVAETLQHSRERVASRWFALKGVFEQPGQELPEAAPVRQKETRTPVLAIFSLAGGVGKTSMVATVGRALSSLGEKVLLTDTTSHGLLPFYFGASELRPDTVRTFSPPSGSTDAPIYLVSHDVEQKGSDEAAQQQLADEIVTNSRGTHRILLDLTANSGWLVRRLARMEPTILVPLAPDMNSIISLQAVERYFHGITGYDGRPLQPYFVLNQFDTSLPLHLDVREVLRRQLGDRLLPFVIRRAPAVSEALAEGMTVVDYAPDTPVAEDYMNLATWLRTIAAPATAGFRNVRWSER
ncbi:cellulose synthase operon protein YhjQ/BcsQ [Edaphobacter sp.]|uniref:cellulose synthase operon protein YhjQ/BcsQ n=1 Tax=Edaphobacter sp. TaxID=1934404 RepID=UPI002DBE0EB9|nr:cellulose synthase operon protein YhjQ/BcsQ [Edaphobacter sp.]HEU5342388.1 cellulose synthase operon protein YhjQ/BcsQ [Edaphobacter sp.]